MTAPFKIQNFDEFEKETHAVLHPPFKSSFGGLMWKELGPYRGKYDWLIKGLLSSREVSFLAGPTQSGKSFFATDLGLCVARGIEFWGRKVRQGAVVYIAAESSTGVTALRLPAYAQHHCLSLDADIPFLTLTRSPNFFSDGEGVEKLIAEILSYEMFIGIKVELVVIDTFSAATGGIDEIKGQNVTLVRDRFKAICDKCRASVLVVHHMNAAGERVKGNGALTADADGVLLVNFERQPSQNPRSPGEIKKDAEGRDVRLVSTMKVKEGANKVKIRFVLKQVILGHDEDNEAITSCIIAVPNGVEDAEQQSAEKLPRMSTTVSTIFRALVEALKKKGRSAPATVDTNAECVTLADWRDEVSILLAGENEDPEKLKERSKKARDRAMFILIDKGYIKKNGDWVWRTGRKVPGIDRIDPPQPEPELQSIAPNGLDDGFGF